MSASKTYCIDSSSLIFGHNAAYPHNVFVGLWKKIDELAEEGRLVAPEDIYREIHPRGDQLSAWVELHREMFQPLTRTEQSILIKLAAAFPPLTDPSRSRACASTADQMVVAHAAANGCLVVSEEKRGSLKAPKLPQLCDHLKVPRIGFLDIILLEGWTFP